MLYYNHGTIFNTHMCPMLKGYSDIKRNKRDVRIHKSQILKKKINDGCWVSFSLNRVVIELYLWYNTILFKYCTHDLRKEMLMFFMWVWSCSCSSLQDVRECDGVWFIDWWSCGNLFSRLFSDRLFSPPSSIKGYWNVLYLLHSIAF